MSFVSRRTRGPSSLRASVLPSAALLLATGCIPDLKSPPGLEDVFEGSGEDWEPPDNRWDYIDGPPAELVGEGYAKGDVFPDFRLQDQHGDELSMWQFYGMVVALDLSTMWCGPCQGIAADVDETWKEYRDEGFIYITMLPEDQAGAVPDRSDLNVWADRFGITAPVISDDEGYSYDIAPDQAWPRLLIIGRDMKVVESQVTPPEDGAIRAAVEAAL